MLYLKKDRELNKSLQNTSYAAALPTTLAGHESNVPSAFGE